MVVGGGEGFGTIAGKVWAVGELAGWVHRSQYRSQTGGG